MTERILWWVKRDARLYDNEAFFRACASGVEVVPFFVFEPLLMEGPDWSQLHTYAIHQAATTLKKNLQHHNSTLIVRTGDVIQELETLRQSIPFTTIYSNQETGLTHTFQRDKQVATWCKRNNIVFREFQTNGVKRGLRNRDDWQSQFVSVMEDQLFPVPAVPPVSKQIKALAGIIPDLDMLIDTELPRSLPIISERTAHEVLRDFLYNRSHAYSGGVSSMLKAPHACSRLSVHLAWGTISLRTVFQATEKRLQELPTDGSATWWRRSLRSFQSRLFWHAHFVQRLEDAVWMEHEPLNPIFKSSLPVVEGEEAERRLEAWLTGTTGFPTIDAAMRYYRETGWLNFRSRAMVTSFAVHGLRLSWQTIVYELAKLMIDYVPGIHVSQVQMQTGVTGINTIRVYSPQKQQLDHDKDCVFIKKQIPELRVFSAADIAQFETLILGTYPRPIIDFKSESKLMKDALYALKKSEIAKLESAGVYQKHGSRKRMTKKKSS